MQGKNSFKNTLIGSLLGGAAYLSAICPRIIRRPAPGSKRFYAHRGLHNQQEGIAENTLEAFKRAVNFGYGIELDVQLSRDGQVVVFHDFDLMRSSGMDRQVDSLSYEELKKISVFTKEGRIPLLQEVLELVQGKVPILVEIKYKGVENGICEKTQSLLEAYQGEYSVESFHPQALLWYRKYASKVRRGQLAMRIKDMEEGGKKRYLIAQHLLLNMFTKPDFIAYDIRAKKEISKSICRRLYACPVAGWTIRSQRELEQVKNYFDWYIFEGFYPKDDK